MIFASLEIFFRIIFWKPISNGLIIFNEDLKIITLDRIYIGKKTFKDLVHWGNLGKFIFGINFKFEKYI